MFPVRVITHIEKSSMFSFSFVFALALQMTYQYVCAHHVEIINLNVITVMNTNLIILHVVCASMAFVHLAAALCGRRGSPAFRKYFINQSILILRGKFSGAAENIIHNSTSRDWSVLRCFLARIIRYESQREEPAPFFECILNAIGFVSIYVFLQNLPLVVQEITATPIPATVDETVLEIKATSPTAGLTELRLCLNHRMSCPEVRHILVCRQAIDDVYITRPIVTQNRSAIT